MVKMVVMVFVVVTMVSIFCSLRRPPEEMGEVGRVVSFNYLPSFALGCSASGSGG
jgi:hypothetical protein